MPASVYLWPFKWFLKTTTKMTDNNPYVQHAFTKAMISNVAKELKNFWIMLTLFSWPHPWPNALSPIEWALAYHNRWRRRQLSCICHAWCGCRVPWWRMRRSSLGTFFHFSATGLIHSILRLSNILKRFLFVLNRHHAGAPIFSMSTKSHRLSKFSERSNCKNWGQKAVQHWQVWRKRWIENST